MKFTLPAPAQQISFTQKLLEARYRYLQQALSETVRTEDIADIDRELAQLSPRKSLNALARKGLRGELLFAVPVLLRANPYLVAYYRLLLGYSQKEFFTTATGASIFKTGESRGVLSASALEALPMFCAAMNQAADMLLEGVGLDAISRELLDDLTLLTLGPQLRGGSNNKRGTDAIARVFAIVQAIVKQSVTSSDEKSLVIKNAAKREVVIEFAADPDLVIRERMAKGSVRNVVAIEIKGGTDYSNVHNRIGEAEKSHQKARAEGYTECWTIVNVAGLDMVMARKESPTTNRFYTLDALSNKKSDEYEDFQNRIAALTGIRLKNSQ